MTETIHDLHAAYLRVLARPAGDCSLIRHPGFQTAANVRWPAPVGAIRARVLLNVLHPAAPDPSDAIIAAAARAF